MFESYGEYALHSVIYEHLGNFITLVGVIYKSKNAFIFERMKQMCTNLLKLYSKYIFLQTLSHKL